MKRIIIFAMIIMTILTLNGCSYLEGNPNLDDFAIKINGTKLGLQTWDNQVSLVKLLGQPVSEQVEKLGPGADTFQGSFVKEQKYPGLELKLFSPKDNGQSFYIIALKISTSQYQTMRGIKVGDGVEKLKQNYPELAMLPDGRTDPNNCAYQLLKDNNYYLDFEIKDGVVSEINIHFEAA